MLLALFHLAEELSYRKNIDILSKHDIERVYRLILPEWIKYIGNLKTNHSHLFSLYLRLNPFEKDVDVTFV